MKPPSPPPPLPHSLEPPPLAPAFMIVDNRKVFFVNTNNIPKFKNSILGNQILFDISEKEERCILFYPNDTFYKISCKDLNKKSSFDRVEKGELMFRTTLTYLYNFVEEYIIQTLCDGIIVWNPGIHNVLNGTMIYSIYKNEQDIFDAFFKVNPHLYTDEFSKQVVIESPQDFKICDFDLRINIKLLESKHKLIVHYDQKKIHAKKINTMNFLFDNGEVLSINNFTEPYKDGNSLISQRILSTSEVNLFANKRIKKVNIVNKQGIVIYSNHAFKDTYFYSGGHGVKQEFVDNMTEKAFRAYLQDYLKKYKELDFNIYYTNDTNSIDLDKPEAQKCYVYLMKDETNSFYKIGISNKPKYRERTLQSEKPTITLICSKQFPTRKIAESFEKALHDAYSPKRIRGEWFNLDDDDIKEITEALEDN